MRITLVSIWNSIEAKRRLLFVVVALLVKPLVGLVGGPSSFCDPVSSSSVCVTVMVEATRLVPELNL